MNFTQEDIQQLVTAVLSSMTTNAKTIEQLVLASTIGDTDSLEVSGGRRITYAQLKRLITEKLASDITTLSTNLNEKVDKIAGKGLSTLDYTGPEEFGIKYIEAQNEVEAYARAAEFDVISSGHVGLIILSDTNSVIGAILQVRASPYAVLQFAFVNGSNVASQCKTRKVTFGDQSVSVGTWGPLIPEATDKVAGLMSAQDKAAVSKLGRSFGNVPTFKFDRVLFNKPNISPDEVGCTGGELALFLNTDYTVAKVCVCNAGGSMWVTLPATASYNPDDGYDFPVPDAVTLWSKPAAPDGPVGVARYVLRPNSIFIISDLIGANAEVAPADDFTAIMITSYDGTPLPLIETRNLVDLLAGRLAEVAHVAESGQLINVHELTFNDGNPFGSLQEALDALDVYRRDHDYSVAPGAVIRFSLHDGDGPERWVSYQWRYGFNGDLDDDITIAENWEPFVPRVQESASGAPGQYIYSENNPDAKTAVLNAPDTFLKQVNGRLMFQKGLWTQGSVAVFYTRNAVPGATYAADGVLTKEVFQRLGTYASIGEYVPTSTTVPVRYPNWAEGGTRTFTLGPATSARAGVMTSADKKKLDAMPAAESGKSWSTFDFNREWLMRLSNAGVYGRNANQMRAVNGVFSLAAGAADEAIVAALTEFSSKSVLTRADLEYCAANGCALWDEQTQGFVHVTHNGGGFFNLMELSMGSYQELPRLRFVGLRALDDGTWAVTRPGQVERIAYKSELDAVRRELFADLWRAWDGTLTDTGQFVKFGVEMDYDKAVRIYGMHELIDRVAVAGATFDAQTELFALNGVDDLTREDMELIDREWLLHQGGAPASKLVQSRTNYAPSPTAGSQGFYNFQALNMEVLCLPSTSYPTSFQGWLSAKHTKLRRIVGTIDLTYFKNPSLLSDGLNCPNLTEVRFYHVGVDFNISKLASISPESLTYLVSNSANGSAAITVTVHADVYAKLTDEANAEWFAILEAAAARNISFATTNVN